MQSPVTRPKFYLLAVKLVSSHMSIQSWITNRNVILPKYQIGVNEKVHKACSAST